MHSQQVPSEAERPWRTSPHYAAKGSGHGRTEMQSENWMSPKEEMEAEKTKETENTKTRKKKD